jgi:hypothetical protein
MEVKGTALKILERDLINNISIINFIKNNRVLSIDIIGNSVVVKGISDCEWIYIRCDDEDELGIIKNKLTSEDVNFGAIDEWMIPTLVKGKEIKWDLPMVQFYLPLGIDLPPIEYKTSPLNMNDANTVYLNSDYKEYISTEYISYQINKGISAGIYENDKLISWGITQDDGAIGFLHTLNDYRRKGYGGSVVLAMIKILKESGKLPFAYIESSNKKSMNLFRKLGFIENKKSHWFKIK